MIKPILTGPADTRTYTTPRDTIVLCEVRRLEHARIKPSGRLSRLIRTADVEG